MTRVFLHLVYRDLFLESLFLLGVKIDSLRLYNLIYTSGPSFWSLCDR